MGNYESSVLKIGDDYITLVDKKAREDITQLQGKINDLPSGGDLSKNSNNIVCCWRKGLDYQMRFLLDGKVYTVPIKRDGGQNGNFDFTGQALYLDADIRNPEKIVATSAYAYKNWTDDICPVHYNNEYRCGGHGISGAWNIITSTPHNLTEADIGTIWTAQTENGTNVDFVIVSIINKNTILLVSDYTGNLTSPVNKSKPITPFTRKTGASGVNSINFSSREFRYVTPSCNGVEFYIRSADGTILNEDGLIESEKYIDIVESYYSLDYVNMLEFLKLNVGNNKNDTYYDENRVRDLYYQTTYRFFPSGCCLISFAATPLKENVRLDYFGGVQCTGLGTIKFAPYTKDYKTPTAIPSTATSFVPDTWEDENFPPYKFFEINNDHSDWAIGVGYVIDHGMGKPEIRKSTANAGTIMGAGNKMYPYIKYIATSSGVDSFGTSWNGYAWKAPMIVKENKISTWYTIGNTTYMEVEFLGNFDGLLEFPEFCDGKRIEIIKKTDTVVILSDVVSSNVVWCRSAGIGSVTLKCY